MGLVIKHEDYHLRCCFISLTSCIGVVTICQGVTKSFAGLVVCRFLLGMFEAGFFPGILYLVIH